LSSHTFHCIGNFLSIFVIPHIQVTTHSGNRRAHDDPKNSTMLGRLCTCRKPTMRCSLLCRKQKTPCSSICSNSQIRCSLQLANDVFAAVHVDLRTAHLQVYKCFVISTLSMSYSPQSDAFYHFLFLNAQLLVVGRLCVSTHTPDRESGASD
jgi:hypothetical protein